MRTCDFRCLVALACLCLFGPASAWAQSANDGFDPNVNSTVHALAVQADGKILIGGDFTSLAGGATVRNHIARLNADGSVDVAFDPNVNGRINTLATQADGKILLGGAFTSLAGGATVRNNIARLNADGSVDTAFDPNANGFVYALAVQADGKILLAGNFTSLAGGGTTRNYIARLNADGSVDATFNPNANDQVLVLAVQADGKILLGGLFESLNGGAAVRNNIARLNADGSVDATFDPNANNIVFALAVQADGKILLGGTFTSLDGGATARNRIARLNADGSVDPTFDPNANNAVLALAVQADGKILLGGNFTTLAGGATACNRIARLRAEGSVDTALDPNANNNVYSLAVQADGKILLGGDFTSLSGATARNHIARLNAEGSVDAAFNQNVNGIVFALAVQADGKLLLGGGFTRLAGGATLRNGIARLNEDGSVDATFDPGANSGAQAFAVQADGKILLGGSFTTLNGGVTTRNRVARVNADGSVDGTFDPNANAGVEAFAVQADGKILVGGNFTSMAGGATVRNHIARLNADGSVDTTFDPNANQGVFNLFIQPDGKILLGGNFTSLAGGATVRNYIARLNADGSVDATFDPNANGNVFALAVQADGKILIGGSFTRLAGGATVRNYIARLNADGSVDASFDPNADNTLLELAVQADGKILLGGSFTSLNGGATARNRIARLNADGSVDATFDPNANSTVLGFAAQADGKIVLSGTFTDLNGGAAARTFIARLSTPQAALQSLTANGSTVTWLRSGAGPELTLPPTLEFSLDGLLYTPMGTLSRFPGGWRGSSAAQPVDQIFYLRARGPVNSGFENGSQGLIESVRQFFEHDHIFADGFQ